MSNIPATSIIAAFQAGNEAKNSKDRLKLERDQMQQARELEEERLKQTQTIEDKRIALEQATRDVQVEMMKQQIAEKYSQTGQRPAGSTLTAPKFSQPSTDDGPGSAGAVKSPIAQDQSGIPQGSVLIHHPLLGDLIAQDPDTYHANQAKYAEIENAPLIKRQKELAETNAQYAQQLEAQKAKNSQDLADKQQIRDLAVENLKGMWQLKAAAAGMDKWNLQKDLTPLTTDEIKLYGITSGTGPQGIPVRRDTVGLAPGTKASSGVTDKIAGYDSLLSAATKAKGLLDQQYKNPDGSTTDGYGAYFKGASPSGLQLAGQKALGSASYPQPLADIGSALNGVTTQLSTEGRLSAEKLKQFATSWPTASHIGNPTVAKSNVESFINQIKTERENELHNAGMPVLNTPASKTTAGPKIIKHDTQGNVIPDGN